MSTLLEYVSLKTYQKKRGMKSLNNQQIEEKIRKKLKKFEMQIGEKYNEKLKKLKCYQKKNARKVQTNSKSKQKNNSKISLTISKRIPTNFSLRYLSPLVQTDAAVHRDYVCLMSPNKDKTRSQSVARTATVVCSVQC